MVPARLRQPPYNSATVVAPERNATRVFSAVGGVYSQNATVNPVWLRNPSGAVALPETDGAPRALMPPRSTISTLLPRESARPDTMSFSGSAPSKSHIATSGPTGAALSRTRADPRYALLASSGPTYAF